MSSLRCRDATARDGERLVVLAYCMFEALASDICGLECTSRRVPTAVVQVQFNASLQA